MSAEADLPLRRGCGARYLSEGPGVSAAAATGSVCASCGAGMCPPARPIRAAPGGPVPGVRGLYMRRIPTRSPASLNGPRPRALALRRWSAAAERAGFKGTIASRFAAAPPSRPTHGTTPGSGSAVAADLLMPATTPDLRVRAMHGEGSEFVT